MNFLILFEPACASNRQVKIHLILFLQTHSKQANRALKSKESLKRKKREEKKQKRATPQLLGQDTKHHSMMNDFTYHTAKAAVVLLGGRSLPQTDIIKAPY